MAEKYVQYVGRAHRKPAATQPREERQTAQNAMGDDVTLHTYVEPAENIEEHCVTWDGLCGYSSVTFHVQTAQEARQLFNALQAVYEYDAS